jgi:hypothetical protein
MQRLILHGHACGTTMGRWYPEAVGRSADGKDARIVFTATDTSPEMVQRACRPPGQRPRARDAITTDALVPDYLRSEIDRLHIDAAPAEESSDGSHSSAGFISPLLTTFLQGDRSAPSAGSRTGAHGVDGT